MNDPDYDSEEAAARREFEYHQRRHDELCDEMLKARGQAAAHHQIMEGLALLHPSLREDYFRSMRHEENQATHQERGDDDDDDQTAPTPLTGGRLQGIPAIEKVMGDHPGVFWTVSAVFHRLSQEGIAPSSERVVRNTLNRAVDAGLVEKRPGEAGTVGYAWKSRVRRTTGDLDEMLSGGPHPDPDPHGVMGDMARNVRQSISYNRFGEDAPD